MRQLRSSWMHLHKYRALMLLVLLWAGLACAQAATLEIRRISPSGDDVPPTQQAVIQFDREMVALGHMQRDSTALPVRMQPDPGCEWRWLNTSELACRLPGEQHFAPATQYTITVGSELEALDGSRLAQPAVATFTTQLPQVEWSSFQAWRAPTLPVFMVRLNMPVTAAELAAHVGFAAGEDDWTSVEVEPYSEKREGPLWLPVPGVPGAMLVVAQPEPTTPLDADTAAGKARRVWQVLPAQPLAAATDYELRVRPGLRSPFGSLAANQAEAVGRLTTYGDFTFQGVSCRAGDGQSLQVLPAQESPRRCRPESVSLQFSAPLPRATLAAIKWQPMPASSGELTRLWRDYPQWRLGQHKSAYGGANPDDYPLPFKLEPMRSYTATVPAGVEDSFGRPLAAPASVTFHTGHRTPFVALPPAQAVLEADQDTIVPLRFTNLDALSFDYQRLTARELSQGVDPGPAQTLNLLERPDLSSPVDQITRGKLGLRALLAGESGVAWGTLAWAPDGYERTFMGQVTPWQVLAKIGHYGSLAWVKRWHDGTPVAAAEVSLMHGPLADLAAIGSAGTTNAQGLAVLPGTAALPADWFERYRSDVDFYVRATQDDAAALLPLDYTFKRSTGDASNYQFWSDLQPPHGHMRAWAVTEHGIYRPDSGVRFAAFVRAEAETALAPPPQLDYTLAITDPQGNNIFEREQVQLSAYGGLHDELHIPATAPMGWYDIVLSWPTTTGTASRTAGRFLVTDFVPAAFQVQTKIHASQFQPGDEVAIDLAATLHAGGPYSDAKTKITTRLVPEKFAPATPLAAGFSFGPTGADAPSAVTLAVDEGRLDHAGHGGTRVRLPDAGEIMYGAVQVEGAVQSARAQWIAERASVPYAARDRFVGLRTSDWMQSAGEAFTVEYLVVTPAGKPAAGSKVRLQLERRSINRVRVKDGAGEYGNEEQIEWIASDHCAAVSKDTPASCELTPEQAGRYRVVATVSDSHGQTQRSTLSTWVSGAGTVVWSHDSQGVTLVPDKASYNVGDVAHVLVQNPYPGAQALVTIERYGVLWKKIVTLEGSAPVIDVPIEAAAFPGAYLSVAIFSPRVSAPTRPDLGRPELALGYVALPVTGANSTLAVQVEPAESEYKPRQRVQVKVRVQDEDGQAPGKTRLVAAVVDQAVLDLLGNAEDYYDPSATLHAPPDGPDVANYSLANQLLTRLQPRDGKGESPGGGGGAGIGPNVRSDFRYAAYWNPELETNADGEAAFQFELPDNLTRWRILVIALSPGAAMGLGDASVRVNLPLQIEPALPNQVRVGDSFSAGFNVTNRTQAQQRVATDIQARGAIEDEDAVTSDELELDAFAHELSWLALQAAGPGTIELSATARAGALADAVAAQIPVQRAGSAVASAEYGSITGRGASIPVQVPDAALPETAQVEVTFAPTLVGGLNGAFAAMRDEPLRTWEMRLSRALLAADYMRLKPALGDSVQWPQAAQAIKNMYESAVEFQAPNGGMAFWVARNEFTSPYLSVYTALIFAWLEQAGHAPPAQVREKLWRYLDQQILDKQNDEPAAPVLRAGALAALALSGESSAGAVAGLLPQLPKMRLFGQALLLQAALASDDRQSADAIVQSLLNRAEESAGAISFNERVQGAYVDLLATPLRTNCAILDGLVRYQSAYGNDNLLGDAPAKLMRWITGRRRTDGGWPNSQENVFCTTAIAHYAAVQETPVEALQGTVALSSRAGQSATTTNKAEFDSRAAAAIKLQGPRLEPGQVAQVELSRSGTGRLYYGVQLHYTMPPFALPAADAGLTVAREYHVQRDGDWQPVTATSVLQRGDIVRVDLLVDAPTERQHVVLTDPLPGAFEAVNRQLATAAHTEPDAEPSQALLLFDSGPWPNMTITTGGFYHRETAFDAVRFFADNLPAGHYHLVYSAQVIAPGTFVAPAAEIKAIYQPDIHGRGEAQKLRVAMPKG